MSTPPVSSSFFQMVSFENGETLPRGLPVEQEVQPPLEEISCSSDSALFTPHPLQAVRERELLGELRLKLDTIERPPEDPNLFSRRPEGRKQDLPSDSSSCSSSSSVLPSLPFSDTTSLNSSESDDESISPILCSSSSSSSPVDGMYSLPRSRSSSPHLFGYSPSRTSSGASLVLNPLFRGRSELSLETMQIVCPNLYSMGDDKKFNLESAAYEIAKCICLKDGDAILKSVLPELYKRVTEPKKRSQWDQLFAHLLFYPQCIDFVRSYFPTEEISYDAFAKCVVPYFSQMKVSPHHILHILSIQTQRDLEHEGSDTLFRGVSLSSSLCREYGLLLLEPQLLQLTEKINHYINAVGVKKLCLNRNVIVELLEKKGKGFNQLNAEQREQTIQLELSRNCECAEGFFRVMLIELYQIRFSPECKALLEMRKMQIAQKLGLDPADPFLTTYVGEVLFLRMINPYLPKQFKDELYQHAVTNLTKVIQNLTNKVRFGSDKPDPVFQEFNGIYDDLVQAHQDFIHKNSTTS